MQTILVCDDDKQIVEAINIYLTGEGFEVIKAYDGYEALEYLEDHEVNLMIVDVMMPGLDGIRTTLKVRETSSIPINEKYMLSIREASDYFGIGIKNMRRLAENNTNKFALYFGNRYLIVRHLFEEYIMECLNNGGMEEVCECEDQE